MGFLALFYDIHNIKTDKHYLITVFIWDFRLFLPKTHQENTDKYYLITAIYLEFFAFLPLIRSKNPDKAIIYRNSYLGHPLNLYIYFFSEDTASQSKICSFPLRYSDSITTFMSVNSLPYCTIFTGTNRFPNSMPVEPFQQSHLQHQVICLKIIIERATGFTKVIDTYHI